MITSIDIADKGREKTPLIYTGILKIKGRAASVRTAFLEGRLEGKKLESVVEESE